MNFVTVQTKTTANFEENLKNIKSIIQEAPKNSLLLFPELCLTGYSYECLDEAVHMSQKAIKSFIELSKDKTIALTLTTKQDSNYFNTFHLFHQGEILHQQNKIELFTLNKEEQYFTAGNKNAMNLFEVGSLKIGVLICFELRFIEYWQKLKGADVILIPALWGEKRKENFEVLSQALAIANQCFVLAVNSSNEDCNGGSSIITPFGKRFLNENQEVLSVEVNLEEIHQMRNHLNVGI
ncbi:MAG: carbon-nitrogen hydrolase family protein [Candidatus Marinarcus sp.]|uniref:carbon-nitrogen hydrolase family protein n=1 Tax=Candidatus Marinarcus sp. TaxID=3100987 RepID=UPI003B005A68